jgi:hypothetical protein
MRTEAEIKEKFDDVFDRELRRKLTEYLTRAPINCRFNCRQRVKGNGAMGFCFNPAVLTKLSRPVFICQDGETATRCPAYDCKNTEVSVKQEFLEEIKSPSICGQKYPKLAVLLWLIQRMPEQEQSTRGARLWALVKESLRTFKDIAFMRWL